MAEDKMNAVEEALNRIACAQALKDMEDFEKSTDVLVVFRTKCGCERSMVMKYSQIKDVLYLPMVDTRSRVTLDSPNIKEHHDRAFRLSSVTGKTFMYVEA